MDKNKVNKLIKAGVKASNDTKNLQQRQVIATAGKLRIQVNKGVDRGKANN